MLARSRSVIGAAGVGCCPRGEPMDEPQSEPNAVRIPPLGLEGLLGVPHGAMGLVIFAHGSGSGRNSPRNQEVAAGLRERGLATLLLDLLCPEEEARANGFGIGLLASRLAAAADWARGQPQLAPLPIGYFGASTGAAGALVGAARDQNIRAIVSRGGRPDLAADALAKVKAATLLIVGGDDTAVLEENRAAFERLQCAKELIVVPGAGHGFEEPGALHQVARHARRWFLRFLGIRRLPPSGHVVFADRRDAGRQLAAALAAFKHEHPLVLALPRGGVPVAFEVAQALGAPLDVALVRKIGAPGHPELGLGAVVEGKDPQMILNEEVVRLVRPKPGYLQSEKTRQLQDLERRRRLYRDGRPAPAVEGRTIIVVDDGIATGGSAKAVLRALSVQQAGKLVLAVPVAPSDTLEALASEADETVCLAAPEPFFAVGEHYEDFAQTTDEEVVRLLERASAR
jgi:putative phosphoribosyl transferase